MQAGVAQQAQPQTVSSVQPPASTTASGTDWKKVGLTALKVGGVLGMAALKLTASAVAASRPVCPYCGYQGAPITPLGAGADLSDRRCGQCRMRLPS
jgi:hypothetical protein